MKFNRNTIILVILALSLGMIVYLGEKKNQTSTQINSENSQVNTEAKIFNFDKKEIKTIVVDNQGKKITFDKTATEIKPWLMINPEKIKASDAAISFLINLINQATNKTKIPNQEGQLKEYGLDKPIGKIELILSNGDEYKINLGKPNFDNSQIYAQIIFPQSQPQNQEIFLVSKSFQYAIERDFQEWKETESSN